MPTAAFGGVAVAGAGAGAVNMINADVLAFVSSSDITANGGSVIVHATNDSEIDAFIGAGAAAIGGGIGGVGVAIGISIAHNYIGFGVDNVDNEDGIEVGNTTNGSALTAAYIEDSDVIADDGKIEVKSRSQMSIDAFVEAIAAGVGAGGVGFGGAGAGSNVVNMIKADSHAYIDGAAETGDTDATETVRANNVIVDAKDDSEISAQALSAAIAAGFGAAGVALSLVQVLRQRRRI